MTYTKPAVELTLQNSRKMGMICRAIINGRLKLYEYT